MLLIKTSCSPAMAHFRLPCILRVFWDEEKRNTRPVVAMAVPGILQLTYRKARKEEPLRYGLELQLSILLFPLYVLLVRMADMTGSSSRWVADFGANMPGWKRRRVDFPHAYQR